VKRVSDRTAATNHCPRQRRGYSILEAILALAILAGAIVTLGEIVRSAALNAEFSRDLAHATVLCESQVSRYLCGELLPGSDAGGTLETDDTGRNWVYSVEQQSIEDLGLIALSVTVSVDGSAPLVSATITRWMIDPLADFSSTTTQQDSSSSDNPNPAN